MIITSSFYNILSLLLIYLSKISAGSKRKVRIKIVKMLKNLKSNL
jgi:hypothetical protein